MSLHEIHRRPSRILDREQHRRDSFGRPRRGYEGSEIMIVATLILAAGIAATIYAIATAPRGYEDSAGFHVDQRNQPRELDAPAFRATRALACWLTH
jgi:hypothetical protein